MKDLKGKTVLITGASRGIGRAIAIEFAKYGSNVIINYRSRKEEAEKTKSEVSKYNVDSMIIQADVAIEQDVKNMFENAIADFKMIHILVNNAGIQSEKPSHLRDMKTFDRTISVNLRAPFLCSREILNHFLEKNYAGVIINISSPHEVIPKPGFVDYAASKSGLKNLTQTLALEYAEKGIRINSVAPGAIITDMNEDWAKDPILRRKVESHIPLGYAATPDEIAPSVVFLASNLAKYIT
ncbi:MAG: SDR family oxidoreductase, partial [Candidatus Lokiarchaeota archaeon]|nr:SDR family oxidoreductase [Candidatus Lokiarchaeota archaeon]